MRIRVVDGSDMDELFFSLQSVDDDLIEIEYINPIIFFVW